MKEYKVREMIAASATDSFHYSLCLKSHMSVILNPE